MKHIGMYIAMYIGMYENS